ncbi:MAG: hypothetical protein V3V49_03855 [Candidatus Krumholzibacteria bacterium]
MERERVNRTAFSIARLGDDSDEKAFWWSRTPQERLEAVELMRQILYGYDPVSERLQRILEIVELKAI